MILVHAFGAVGMACLLIAYYLVSTGRLSPQTVLYQGLNLVAGIILAVYAAILGAAQAIRAYGAEGMEASTKGVTRWRSWSLRRRMPT